MFGHFAQSNLPGTNAAPNAAPFGSSSIFGAPQQPAATQQPSAFGGFGAGGSTGMSAGNLTSLAAPTTPYAITTDFENNFNIKLLAITAMPAYRNRSFEVSWSWSVVFMMVLCLHFLFSFPFSSIV